MDLAYLTYSVDMDRAQLELVVALDEAGSLTGAARALHTAQPAVTRRLATLERQLGTTLFDRGRHGAVATPAGRAVVTAARDALQALTRADETAAHAAAGGAGLLRIGATPTLGADVLPAALASFRRGNPKVRLELVAHGDSAWLRRELADGRLDVALAVLPSDADPSVEVAAEAGQEFAVVVAADDPLAEGANRRNRAAPLPRAALAGHPVVAIHHGEGLRLVLDNFFAGLGAEPTVAIETSEREMLLPLVAAGLGATLVPANFARQRVGAGVVARTLDPPLVREVGVLLRAGSRDQLARTFATLAGACLAQA
jgi:DNA-binding transcriptional LysR family regulator